MYRRIFLPFIMICIINSYLMMTTQLSLGRLFPASRNRQRAASLISQAIESSFFKRPPFQPPKPKSSGKSKGTIKSLPLFPDVLWKFNKRLVNNTVLKNSNQSKNSSEPTNLAEHFSKFSEFASAMVKQAYSKLKVGTEPSNLDNELMSESQRNEIRANVRQKINKINEYEMKIQKQYSTRGTTSVPIVSDKTKVNKFAGVTNSPIFYIQLPAAPYEYHPSLGYISRPASPDLSNFLRPQIDFLNNGRPTNIYQPATPVFIGNASDAIQGLMTTTSISTVSLSTIQLQPVEENITSTLLEELTTGVSNTELFTMESTTESSTYTSTTLLPLTNSTTLTSSSSGPISLELSSISKATVTSSPVESTTSASTELESTEPTNNYTTTSSNGGYTNSPITWLKGPYFFNGRPDNLFIFNSPPNKDDRFEYLHKLYSKPGVYL